MYRTTMTVLASAALAATAVAQQDEHDHGGDVVVAQDGAGALAFEGDFDEIIVLPASDGGVNGWILDDPGFAALDEDEPDEGLFQLANGADVHLQLVSADAALNVWDPFFNTVLAPNDSFALDIDGTLDGEFDTHGFWHIDSDDAGFDPMQTEWEATFRFIDTGATGYADSGTFTLTFSNVPAPGAISLAALSGVVLAGRRRRA